MSWFFRAILVATTFAFVSGCGSSALKMRREQRDKALSSASAKLYCEFVNGEEFPDIDVQLNLQMSSKCDSDKNFSITNYKTPSEISGMMFCCAVHPKIAGNGSTAGPAMKSEPTAKAEKSVVPSAAPAAAKSGKDADGLDQ